jgi:hypothetical protein
VTNKLKAFAPRYYESQSQPWVPGTGPLLTFNNFIPILGSDGRSRNIIDILRIHAVLNVTVATAASLGPDNYRLVQSVTVEQLNGIKRWNNVSGDALRITNYMLLGEERTREAQQIPVGAAQTVTLTFDVPLIRPYARNPYAYSMAAQAFKQMQIAPALASQLNLGTCAFTINSGNYYVEAICHDEPTPMAYAVDTLQVNDFASVSQSQINLSLTGRPQDICMYMPGAGGGGVWVSSVNTVQIVGVYPQALAAYPDLALRYPHERGIEPGAYGTTNQQHYRIDPFMGDPADGSVPNAVANPRALMLLALNGGGPNEGPVVQNLLLNLQLASNPASNLRVISRMAIPRDPLLDAQIMQTLPGKTKLAPQTGGVPLAAGDAAYFMAQYQ